MLFKKTVLILSVLAALLLSSCSSSSSSDLGAETKTTKGEQVIVIVRHAEKPKQGLGQLSITGLKHALLLPSFFKQNFDQADYIFAPNPAIKHFENHGDQHWYCYVRPLVTIEPTAITLGLPVDTSLGLDDTTQLVDKLLRPEYHNSTIYIAWEHSRIVDIAHEMVKKMQATDITIPEWHNDNFNMVFVFRIDWNKPVGKQLSFSIFHDHLTDLNNKKVAPDYLNRKSNKP